MDKKGTKDFHFELEFDLEKRVQEVARRNALLRMIDPEELNKEIQKNIEQYKTENSKKESYETKDFHFEPAFDLEKRVQEVARRNALLWMIDPEELNKEIQKNIEQYKTENSKKKNLWKQMFKSRIKKFSELIFWKKLIVSNKKLRIYILKLYSTL